MPAAGQGFIPVFSAAGDFAAERFPLDAAYVATASGLVPKQLLRGGARIAYLLNRAFAK